MLVYVVASKCKGSLAISSRRMLVYVFASKRHHTSSQLSCLFTCMICMVTRMISMI